MNGNPQDISAITSTLQSYIDGVKHNDSGKMRAIFHEDATISRHKPQGFEITTKFRDMIANFLENSTPIIESSPDFDGDIIFIDQVEDVASARILEKNLDGHNFHTYFLLHKIDGRWMISSKATRPVPL
jgi:hypothetical protein|eukprot:TRINITY_DN1455_c1_g1_i1.p1 TRINITY_DN1455_c1_g1~~TRINITY_DN1455_c1_g1_i1.p1  ORF type:complete len:129 (+),score=12.26 TRINITY_DN1455_c1_g1_i1:273-659(+)